MRSEFGDTAAATGQRRDGIHLHNLSRLVADRCRLLDSPRGLASHGMIGAEKYQGGDGTYSAMTPGPAGADKAMPRAPCRPAAHQWPN